MCAYQAVKRLTFALALVLIAALARAAPERPTLIVKTNDLDPRLEESREEAIQSIHKLTVVNAILARLYEAATADFGRDPTPERAAKATAVYCALSRDKAVLLNKVEGFRYSYQQALVTDIRRKQVLRQTYGRRLVGANSELARLRRQYQAESDTTKRQRLVEQTAAKLEYVQALRHALDDVRETIRHDSGELRAMNDLSGEVSHELALTAANLKTARLCWNSWSKNRPSREVIHGRKTLIETVPMLKALRTRQKQLPPVRDRAQRAASESSVQAALEFLRRTEPTPEAPTTEGEER